VVTEAAAGSTVDDVLAVEPVIRRVVASRIDNPNDVDDLVHDCMERLLKARLRLAPESVLPVGVVAAQNLVISRARATTRRLAGAHRLADLGHFPSPEDEVLAGEARQAVVAALAQLPERERRDLLAYEELGAERVAAASGQSAGAMRVRMARTRAKLRLEYLLAFRHVELPTPVCERVLLAISGGDTRRQRALGAGEHLLDCATCAALSEPLEQRSLGLTAVSFPLAAAGWVAGKARTHPITTAAGTVGAAVGAIVAASLLASTPASHHPIAQRPPVTTIAAPTAPPLTGVSPVVPAVTVAGVLVHPDASFRSETGRAVQAEDASVQSVVTHNGFWVGTSSSIRVWVELVGPLEPLHIVAGDEVRFTGTVTANPPTYPQTVGVTAAAGAALLTKEGAHIDVGTTSITVLAPS
jgi:RNA polymerase sigma factor (sigma-70 family)